MSVYRQIVIYVLILKQSKTQNKSLKFQKLHRASSMTNVWGYARLDTYDNFTMAYHHENDV